MTMTLRNAMVGLARRRCAPGFSIVELLVVVVILGVLSAMMAPRLASISGRGTEVAAERAAGVLSAAARRNNLTTQRLALEFNGEREDLALLVFDPARGEWREDGLTGRVSLSGSLLREATSDGVRLEQGRWVLELPQSGPRPLIRMVFTDTRGRDPWLVVLAPRAARAEVRAGDGAGADADESVDLDALGRGEQPW